MHFQGIFVISLAEINYPDEKNCIERWTTHISQNTRFNWVFFKIKIQIGKLSGANKTLYWALKVLYSIQFLISIVPITCTCKLVFFLLHVHVHLPNTYCSEIKKCFALIIIIYSPNSDYFECKITLWKKTPIFSFLKMILFYIVCVHVCMYVCMVQ